MDTSIGDAPVQASPSLFSFCPLCDKPFSSGLAFSDTRSLDRLLTYSKTTHISAMYRTVAVLRQSARAGRNHALLATRPKSSAASEDLSALDASPRGCNANMNCPDSASQLEQCQIWAAKS